MRERETPSPQELNTNFGLQEVQYSRRLHGDSGQMCPTHPGKWVKPCHASTHRWLKHMHRTTTEGIEILHSRYSGLIGLRLWISLLSKCSLTTYWTLSRWVPFRAEKLNFYLGWNLQGQKTHTTRSAVIGTNARKGDILISRVESEFWSSVGTLEDCIEILARWPYFFEGKRERVQC